MKRSRVVTILAVTLLAWGALYGYLHVWGEPKVYFLELHKYLVFSAALFLVVLASLFIPSLEKGGEVVAAVLLGVMGYALLEPIYYRFPLLLPGSLQNHSLDIISGDLNYYFIHRSYQYVPLLLMVAVLFSGSPEEGVNFLKAGDWNVITSTINRDRPLPWKRVVIWFSMVTLGLAILALVLRCRMGILMRPMADQLVLFPANILGAINNCFIEELLFRGILLTVFVRILGEKHGNFLQALLFGLVHFPSFNMYHYLAKVLVFTFVGWLFGRAVIETGGLKCNWIMHSAIVISMYIAQTV
ncbi:MAG: CPBP family intramembrane glutamic endopeptidase [Candidatus Eremiobacteraeota bacterium]|nr:CPBP family intramembrane glutamic endopeptidase [Candidatus Eremiobacteraeota bacterium]